MADSKVYASTGAFASRDLGVVLETALAAGITRIELSSGLDRCGREEELVERYMGRFDFLVHNYFPPPPEPFLLNLAASGAAAERSMAMARAAVDLSARCGAEFYSIHSGFTLDPEGWRFLGDSRQAGLRRMPLEEAKANFAANIRELNSYARSRGIRLAIENNAIAAFALTEGRNETSLGATIEDMEEIFGAAGADLCLLLDLGHALVNTKTVGLDIERLIRVFDERIIAVHVSTNDAAADSNSRVAPGDRVLEYVRALRDRYLIVEVYGLEPDGVREQMELLAGAAGL